MARQASDFIRAMSRATSSVSIVTTNGQSGRYGLTVNSMVSVSAEPPLLLVCINRSSVAHDAIHNNGRFMINVLAEHQHQIADKFAGRGQKPYCYEPDAWEFESSDLPKLRSATAHFECRTVETVSAGTHTIFIGRVLCSSAGQQTSLLYGNRSYGRQRSLQ
jgi:flavin reductase